MPVPSKQAKGEEMKTAEQWRNEIQSAMGDHLSLAQEARLLERSAAAIKADALRHAAAVCREHRGSAAKERMDRIRHSIDELAAGSIRDEERGEDIAAELIGLKLQAEAAKLEEAK